MIKDYNVTHMFRGSFSFYMLTDVQTIIESISACSQFVIKPHGQLPRFHSSIEVSLLLLCIFNTCHFLFFFCMFFKNIWLNNSIETQNVFSSLQFNMLFCFSTDDSFIRPVTFWIVGDFDSPSGRQLLYDAIKHQVSIYNFFLYLCLSLLLSS